LGCLGKPFGVDFALILGAICVAFRATFAIDLRAHGQARRQACKRECKHRDPLSGQFRADFKSILAAIRTPFWAPLAILNNNIRGILNT
jgi:hypothetical protein